MSSVTLQELQQEAGKKAFPRFRSGQTVRVHQKIHEGDKERIQIFEGLIIAVSGNNGIHATITVRRIVDGIGVEKVFAIHSPFIEKIELVKEAKVRRSRIYFMRNRSGKAARLQEKFYSDAELAAMMPHEVTEEEVEEAIQHSEQEEAKAEEGDTVTSKASEQPEEEKAQEEKTEQAEVEQSSEEAEENKEEEVAEKKEGEK